VETQIRVYDITRGRLDEFVQAWKAGVLPLREQSGFHVTAAWVIPEASRFVWILAYDGPGDFATADATYYASAGRSGLDPDPAQWIESAEEHAAHHVV
jgi:hypothetical protein